MFRFMIAQLRFQALGGSPFSPGRTDTLWPPDLEELLRKEESRDMSALAYRFGSARPREGTEHQERPRTRCH